MFAARPPHFIAVVLFTLSFASALCAQVPANRQYLDGTWRMQSSCVDSSKGEQISSTGFDASKWIPAEVPGTVVGAQVTDKVLPDPDYGMNLKSFPGFVLDSKGVFATRDMPDNSPYRCSFWFRTEFSVPDSSYSTPWLHFLGINYRANIWLNGKKVADKADVAGAYREFEFRVGDALKKGSRNALAVEIFAPEKWDLGITWVDWNPTPPDKDMGMWREVFLSQSGDVSLRRPFVNSKLDSDYKSAELTLSALLTNTTGHPVKPTVQVDLAGTQISQAVELAANESKTVRFAPGQFPQLQLANPHLWWPYQMGEPYLYKANFRVLENGRESDSSIINFGIREVTSEVTSNGGRLFTVNGKKVLIRGAAWAPDMLLRWSSARLDADLNYVKDMGLNSIRLEGKVDRDEFFDKTDRLGLLVMPGWCCCDAWERWKHWTPETKSIAAASLTDQLSRLRNHPSVFVWFYGSDNPPPPEIEHMYLDIIKETEWPNPTVSSASEQSTTVTGKSGVKMTGPYEYVPPVYWLEDTQAGGAYGYNTETSPGPAIPPKESLEKFIPKDHLWPIDEYWNFHSGRDRFANVNVFTEALNKRYGAASSLDDYERKAQAMAYDNERSMFEAYARNKYVSTGVIQWMLDNAWPSLIWHLYDYYLVPAGGYFGTKKAQEIVHVQYDYTTNSVSVINGTYQPISGVEATARLFNIDGLEIDSENDKVELPADSAVKAFDLPKPANLSTTYFLKLYLHDASGKLISDNFYWLSTKLDTLDWSKRRDTVYTPQKEFADLTGLNSLRTVKLEWNSSARQEAGKQIVTVNVKNPTSSVAFQVHLRVTKGQDGDDVVPIFWGDNYFSLLPGEDKTATATYAVSDTEGKPPVLELDGFNIAPASANLSH
ncbi:MAG TPA: glycoside hydrolase family 2 TIM barrel-domain containing protein [Candidatus Eremiobacteraceae bacterium]|nr:glycoside hydrolase family 2 TIM barrel-domain containing protein [Candidatus Eremiobacteraceae bacterium]